MGKNPKNSDYKGKILIYAWSIDTKRLDENAHIAIPLSEFLRHLKGNKFQPLGIERHPASGNYFIVAARQGAIAEITPNGTVIAVPKLTKWHQQAEGITFSVANELIISDEGDKKSARLTQYPPSE